MVNGYFIDDDYRELLRAKVKRYRRATKKALATIGTAAANESDFFDRVLENKGKCTVEKFLHVMRWLDENTPLTEAERNASLKESMSNVN